VACANSIELDDDQSDAESTDSATGVFADIPLPSPTSTPSAQGILLPHIISTNSSSPTLGAIPLPSAPVCEKMVTDDQRTLSATESTAAVDASSRTDESVGRNGDAVRAKTSVGTITVLLNRKLGPRLSRASIFDVPDDNVKEVNRKLLKLRRLKKMKKGKDAGQSEPEVGPVTGRKALQQRISEWKEELLNDQNYKSKRRKGPLLTAGVGDNSDKQPDTVRDDLKTEPKDQIPPLMISPIKIEAVDSKLLPSQKSDDAYMMKLYDSFMKVASSSDLVQLDWPREMIQETRLAPKLTYSCNPLYFNFRKLQLLTQQNGDSREESKKHKHQRKRKKTRVGKVDDSVAGQQDVNSLNVSKDKTESHKTLTKDRSNTTKERAKISQNSLDQRPQNKRRKKSAAQTGKPSNASSHSAQHNKHLAADDKSGKPGSGKLSQNTQPPVGDDDLARLTATLKDTAKSRWDTSSDSELETTQVSARGDRKTSEVVRRSRVSDRAKTQQHSPDNRSPRSPASCRWSSHSSARSRNRSRDWSRSSSATSYSRSSSSYRSSSYSYRRRRRRRLTHDSSRSSCSYSDTGSDYSRSSRSYSRSRSISRRRRWRSRSYSRSRSSSPSRSPPRSQLQPHKNRSDWRSQITSKRPVAEPTSAPQKKAPTQPAKLSNSRSTTDAGSETKNSSDDVKPAATEATGATDSSTEPKHSITVNSEESTEDATVPALEDVKSIPTPEEHMQSIPLPVVPEHPHSNKSFIGPVLPKSHPLAHKQDIPLPATAKFQCIGPNDPLVFHQSMPPPPPPPASLTSHSRASTSLVPPPRPPSPPTDDMDDIAGDEDPIPQMLDVRTLKPATFIPPEQDEQYGALRRQAELHARRQQIREETGMDIADDDDDDSTEPVADEQLADQAYLDEAAAAAMFSATPVIQVPQHHLVGQPLSTSVAMMASGAGLVPVQMVPAAGRGLVGLEPSLVPLVHQGQTPTLLAVSPAAAALARAQEEAEAEAQIRQQVAAAQAIAAAQRRRTAELIQLIPGGQVGVGAVGSPALATLRPAGLSLQAVPLQALTSQQPQQQLIQLPTGRIIGVQPSVIPSGVQVMAQPQPQPAPLVIGPNGTVLRLIR